MRDEKREEGEKRRKEKREKVEEKEREGAMWRTRCCFYVLFVMGFKGHKRGFFCNMCRSIVAKKQCVT